MLTFPSGSLYPTYFHRFNFKRCLTLFLLLLGLIVIARMNNVLQLEPIKPQVELEEYLVRHEEEEEMPIPFSQEMIQIGKDIASRRDRLRDGCRRSPLPGELQKTLDYNVFYFFDNNASVCLMGKTGTSTWRIHLRNLNGGPPLDCPMNEDPRRRKLMERPLDEILRFFNSTVKILTVRHPLTRLVSAYRQKYKGGKPLAVSTKKKSIAGNTWHDNFEEFWLPAMLSNFLIPNWYHLNLGLDKPLNRSIRYDDWIYEKICNDLRPRITFKQFLHHVIKTFLDDFMNSHWDMYHVQCSVCYFDYNFIIKTETMTEEVAYIAKRLGLKIDPRIRMNKTAKKDQIESEFQYFAKIPQWMRKKIYEIYADDMRLFDYDLPDNFLEDP